MGKNTRIISAFPASLREEALAVSAKFNKKDIFPSCESFYLDGEKLELFRLFCSDVSWQKACAGTSKTQCDMLRCVYMRHHDGFVGQAVLQSFVGERIEPFVAPFALSLVGELVYEILPVFNVVMRENLDIFADFIAQNPQFFARIQARMISYYDLHHRDKAVNLRSYLGYKICKELKRAAKL